MVGPLLLGSPGAHLVYVLVLPSTQTKVPSFISSVNPIQNSWPGIKFDTKSFSKESEMQTKLPPFDNEIALAFAQLSWLLET